MKKINLKNFKAVFFDMDGILVDSMPYHFISWFETLKKYGVRITVDDVYEMEGAKWDKVVRLGFKRENKRLTEAVALKICNERKILFRKYIKKFVFDGIENFLKKLKAKKFILGLVSGSSLSEAKNMLPKAVFNIFDVKVTGDIVKFGKPHPEPYLTAAKNLNLPVEKCLVIENAPYGIKSAKSAGMFCIAVATSLYKEKLYQADIKVNVHKDLYKLFL
jgi:beta-phosphoglucomutase